MDFYLQRQQLNSKLPQENYANNQNVNIGTISQPNNNNNNLQYVHSQIPQSSIVYPPNTLQVSASKDISMPQFSNLSGTSLKSNPVNPSSLLDSKSPSTSQEFQSSSFESQTENNSDIKNENVTNTENVKKKPALASNSTLKEIIGIVPHAGPDHQHLFVCRFSDSMNEEYVPNKQMRKRFALQLIKFYESHIEEKMNRPSIQKTESSNAA